MHKMNYKLLRGMLCNRS